jgi:hypothetical protein
MKHLNRPSYEHRLPTTRSFYSVRTTDVFLCLFNITEQRKACERSRIVHRSVSEVGTITKERQLNPSASTIRSHQHAIVPVWCIPWLPFTYSANHATFERRLITCSNNIVTYYSRWNFIALQKSIHYSWLQSVAQITTIKHRSPSPNTHTSWLARSQNPTGNIRRSPQTSNP